MKLRSKETYWLLKNGLIQSYPSLQKDIRCDILIIGAGVTGALMAYQFSGEGFSTVLIDKRDVGMGSTSATTALIQYEIDEPLYSLIDKVGEDAAIDSYRGGVTAINKLQKIIRNMKADCSFEKKQSLYIANKKSDVHWLMQEYDCRKSVGLDVSWLTKIKLKNQFGIHGNGGILSKAAASLDAYKLTHALLKHSVQRNGLRVFDHSSVETIEYGKRHNFVKTDTARTIECKHIIYATGYESQEMLGEKIVNLLSTYAFVSEPLSIMPIALKKTIFWNTQNPYLYLRATPDNRIMVGGADEQFKDSFKRDKLIDEKETLLVESARKLMPSLKLIPDFTWAGTFGSTKDSLPYIGEHPDYPKSYFVLGFGGNGITFSVMAMDILSDAMADRPNRFLKYYRFGR
jgi:glycine/D-amino acid oxidase-like deaminating enzyme